jgi:hypothetical protein
VRAGLTRDHLFHELYDADDTAAPNGSEPSYPWSAMAALMMLEGK